MKPNIFLIAILLLFAFACKKEPRPKLPPEYEYIRGKWKAYEISALIFRADFYTRYTIPVTNYDVLKEFNDECVISHCENIKFMEYISSISSSKGQDTNIVYFVVNRSHFRYHIKEDIIDVEYPLYWFSKNITTENFESGYTYYRRVN